MFCALAGRRGALYNTVSPRRELSSGVFSMPFCLFPDIFLHLLKSTMLSLYGQSLQIIMFDPRQVTHRGSGWNINLKALPIQTRVFQLTPKFHKRVKLKHYEGLVESKSHSFCCISVKMLNLNAF